ncbi:hypothetical protein AB834_01105 [PVC group bacterium (ex Bugula neritina AB1)]|nr:hypothetical protein AB834_01105 [PVC group bacterium (ex Bugula neritina AB1)]
MHKFSKKQTIIKLLLIKNLRVFYNKINLYSHSKYPLNHIITETSTQSHISLLPTILKSHNIKSKNKDIFSKNLPLSLLKVFLL